jgi:hypothetical protein
MNASVQLRWIRANGEEYREHENIPPTQNNGHASSQDRSTSRGAHTSDSRAQAPAGQSHTRDCVGTQRHSVDNTEESTHRSAATDNVTRQAPVQVNILSLFIGFSLCVFVCVCVCLCMTHRACDQVLYLHVFIYIYIYIYMHIHIFVYIIYVYIYIYIYHNIHIIYVYIHKQI